MLCITSFSFFEKDGAISCVSVKRDIVRICYNACK